MKMRMKAVMIAVAVLLVAGCSKGTDPKDVARKFWDGVKAGEIEKVRPLVTDASFALLKQDEQSGGMKKEGEFTLGDAKAEGDRATVATKITDEGFAIPFETVLVKEKGAWKVDANQTMASVMTGAMAAMGQALGEGMKEAAGALEKAGKELGAEAQAMAQGAAPKEAPQAAAPAGAFVVGDPVSVKWKGKWWPASVIEIGRNGRWKIHYDGYDNSWDEWVGADRIKTK